MVRLSYIEKDTEEMGWERVRLFHLAGDKSQWRANAIINFQSSYEAGKFLNI